MTEKYKNAISSFTSGLLCLLGVLTIVGVLVLVCWAAKEDRDYKARAAQEYNSIRIVQLPTGEKFAIYKDQMVQLGAE
jgi:hypothetical protein